MKLWIGLASLVFSLNAHAVDPALCPRVIDLDMDTINARVHTSFTRDADYKAAVEALNRMGRAHITYSLVSRAAKSCKYTADRGSSMNGEANLYTKSVFDAEDNRSYDVHTLRTSFWVSGIRAQFALFLVVEDYQPDSLKVYTTSMRDRSLMALLTPPSGRKSHRESGKVTFTVVGSR